MNRKSVRILLAGVASMALPAPALAQSAVDEVIVTAERQQYRGDVPIKDLPQVVNVVGVETIKDLGLTRLSSALDLTSGVTRQQTFGGFWDAFAIRGFAGDENSGGIILVNGYRTASSGPRDSSTIERIEVFKGPTSALFGRGDPGGVVNIVTKRPKFSDSGSVSIQAGSWSVVRAEADLNKVVTDDLAFRVSGGAEQGDSFRDTIEYNKFSIAPALVFKPFESTTINLDSEYIQQEFPFDRGVVAVAGQLGVVPVSRFLGEPGDGPNELEGFTQQAQVQHDFNSDWSLIAGGAYRIQRQDGWLNEADLGRQTLSATNPILVRRRTDRHSYNDAWGARAELNGNIVTGPLEHHAILGADWDTAKGKSRQLRYRSPPIRPGLTLEQLNGINIYNPVYGLLVPTNSNLTNNRSRSNAHGFYAADQIDVTDKLQVRLAGRFDWYEIETRNYLNNTVSRLEVKKKFTPQVGVIYDVTESLSVYGSWGKGFRPQGGSSFAGVPFPPEESEAYEAGLRYVAVDGSIAANAAVFQMEKTNVLVADPVNAGFSMAVGGAKSRGFEADFTGNVTETLRVWANYSYIDAFFTDEIIERDFGRNIPAGSPLINIPEHSGNLMVLKDFVVGDRTLTVGGGVNYVGRRLGETGSNFFLPGYTLVRLNASYDITENAVVYAEVNNLFDKEHYVSSYHQWWVMPGAPRNFNVRLSYSF